MARIAGVNIPDDKHACIALTYIYGVGRRSAMNICEVATVNAATRVRDLDRDELTRLQAEIGKLTVEGDLRRIVNMSIKRLQDLRCYRGIRHRRKMPLRGQRTRTNARTRKGPRRIVKK